MSHPQDDGHFNIVPPANQTPICICGQEVEAITICPEDAAYSQPCGCKLDPDQVEDVIKSGLESAS